MSSDTALGFDRVIIRLCTLILINLHVPRIHLFVFIWWSTKLSRVRDGFPTILLTRRRALNEVETFTNQPRIGTFETALLREAGKWPIRKLANISNIRTYRIERSIRKNRRRISNLQERGRSKQSYLIHKIRSTNYPIDEYLRKSWRSWIHTMVGNPKP
jgi:hypothetical protein